MAAEQKRADEEGPATPRWVKVFAIVALFVIAVLVVIMATGVGGEHGPRRHMSSGSAAGQAAPAAAGPRQ
jgi:hypothetical protein